MGIPFSVILWVIIADVAFIAITLMSTALYSGDISAATLGLFCLCAGAVIRESFILLKQTKEDREIGK